MLLLKATKSNELFWTDDNNRYAPDEQAKIFLLSGVRYFNKEDALHFLQKHFESNLNFSVKYFDN